MVSLFAFTVLLAACSTAHVEVTKTTDKVHAPTSVEEVRVIFTKPEGRRFYELGRVNAWGYAADETAEMHLALREKAAALGAQAVLVTDEGMLERDGGGLQRWANGVAIRWGAPE